jgi:Flp pilus assembly protein TadB
MEYLASDKTPEPLHEVFHTAFVSVKELGIPPIDALKKAAKVSPELTDLGTMATTLEEAQKNGADLAEVVEMFASDARNRRLLQKEIESKTAQGVFTSNFLLGIGVGVPALLQLFGKISDNPTIAGGSSLLIQVMSACCYLMMIIGYLIIRRMAQI